MKNLALTFAFFIALLTANTLHAQQAHSLPNRVCISADIEDGMISIEWNTKKEINTRYFIIEKSYDGTHYEYLGTKQAGGNTVFPRSYSFTDIDESVKTFYRVTLILMDGGTAISAPVSLHIFGNTLDSHIAER